MVQDWLARRALVGLVMIVVMVPGCGDDDVAEFDPGEPPSNSAPSTCKPLEPNGDTNTADFSWADVSCFVVRPGTHSYGNVVVGAGQVLEFAEAETGGDIRFYAASILVERGGLIRAGTAAEPFGAKQDSKLTIGLWGADPSKSASSAPPPIACGGIAGAPCFPATAKPRQTCCTGSDPADPCSQACTESAGKVVASEANAVFEGFGAPASDTGDGTFGRKVLAVGYGGRLQLIGAKGVAKDLRVTADELVGGDGADPPTQPKGKTTKDVPAACTAPAGNDIASWAAPSGESWVRLNANASPQSPLSLSVDRDVGWRKDDEVVVATTDWHASHSEVVALAEDARDRVLTLKAATPVAYEHRGEPYTRVTSGNGQPDLRASVGLLSRSIRIVSRGARPENDFPTAAACGYADPTAPKPADDPDCFFGGHVMFRQGFGQVQLQGVELHQLGQGGRMGRYPLHFHMVKQTEYTRAFVRDSAIWDSMTRFVTLHAAHDIALERNVGYLSVGHSYYLEDASEIDNALCFNLGVGARPAYEQYFQANAGRREGRRVPAILFQAFNPDTRPEYRDGHMPGTDTLFPTTFWIMNAHNDFVGNQAVGVGGFGTCYWLLGSGLSGSSQEMVWAKETFTTRDYASSNLVGARQAPLKRFAGNGCGTAPYALMTELASVPPDKAPADMTPFDATHMKTQVDVAMLPRVQSNFNPLKHKDADSTPWRCSFSDATEDGLEKPNAKYCVTSVIDRFTTSFNWAERNLGSVWLRPMNYVFVNGAITDQLFGGLGFVSGGSWDQVLPEYLTITKDSLFVGTTRPSATAGAYVEHEAGPAITTCNGTFCPLPVDGTALPQGGFSPQRLITIYDGPFFSDGSAFENVRAFDCPVGANRREACGVYATTDQPVSDRGPDLAEVIHAGVGWKQPNGFYYPPAFAFRNTSFGSASVTRHNVLDAAKLYWQGGLPPSTPIKLHLPGSALTPASGEPQGGVTPIDYMTVLNDLDGTLNGVIRDDAIPRTAGVSNNPFYSVPGSAPECSSFGTVTMPADFVSTVVAKLDQRPTATRAHVIPTWIGNSRPIVPIYRQLTLPGDTSCATDSVCNDKSWSCSRASLLMGTDTGQAPGLVVNGGTYYFDTNIGATTPRACIPGAGFAHPQFVAGDTYVVYNLFATSSTKVSYQLYVGDNFVPSQHGAFVRAHPHWAEGEKQMVVTADLGIPSHGSATVTNGYLTITLDHAAAGFAFDPNGVTTCAPHDLCQQNDTKDGCIAERTRYPVGSRLRDQVDAICGRWVERKESEKDGVFLEDCPHGGCVGYAFTLQATEPGGAYVPVPFTSTPAAIQTGTPYADSPGWSAKLKNAPGSPYVCPTP